MGSSTSSFLCGIVVVSYVTFFKGDDREPMIRSVDVVLSFLIGFLISITIILWVRDLLNIWKDVAFVTTLAVIFFLKNNRKFLDLEMAYKFIGVISFFLILQAFCIGKYDSNIILKGKNFKYCRYHNVAESKIEPKDKNFVSLYEDDKILKYIGHVGGKYFFINEHNEKIYIVPVNKKPISLTKFIKL